MPTAIHDTTTSRRAALRDTVATVVASLTAPGPTSADAELIRLCGQLVALRDDFDEVYGRRTTIEEEDATEHELIALDKREDALLGAMEAAGPPTTIAGIVAVAQAGLAIYLHRDTEGTAIAEDDAHWLLLQCAEALTANTEMKALSVQLSL
jgi:hypothetical protein